MAFTLRRGAGNVTEPVVVELYASGTVRPGMVVEFSRTGGAGVGPASSSTTITNIFGVCQDYAQGASDVKVRVIPILPGQIWEADTVNAVNTNQIGLRQRLYGSNSVLLANDSYNSSGATGVFFIWDISSATSGSGKVLGEFVRTPIQDQNATLFHA